MHLTSRQQQCESGHSQALISEPSVIKACSKYKVPQDVKKMINLSAALSLDDINTPPPFPPQKKKKRQRYLQATVPLFLCVPRKLDSLFLFTCYFERHSSH